MEQVNSTILMPVISAQQAGKISGPALCAGHLAGTRRPCLGERIILLMVMGAVCRLQSPWPAAAAAAAAAAAVAVAAEGRRHLEPLRTPSRRESQI